MSMEKGHQVNKGSPSCMGMSVWESAQFQLPVHEAAVKPGMGWGRFLSLMALAHIDEHPAI